MAQDDHSIMHVTLSTPQPPLSSSTNNEHSDLHRELCGPNYTTVEERQLLESCGDGACIASWLIHTDTCDDHVELFAYSYAASLKLPLLLRREPSRTTQQPYQ